MADPVSLDELIGRYLAVTRAQPDLQRLFIRQNLEADPDQVDPDLDGEDLTEFRRRQAAGELAPELDPGFVLLVMQAMTSVATIFPGEVKRLLGLDPSSEEFFTLADAQLRAIVRRLADPAPDRLLSPAATSGRGTTRGGGRHRAWRRYRDTTSRCREIRPMPGSPSSRPWRPAKFRLVWADDWTAVAERGNKVANAFAGAAAQYFKVGVAIRSADTGHSILARRAAVVGLGRGRHRCVPHHEEPRSAQAGARVVLRHRRGPRRRLAVLTRRRPGASRRAVRFHDRPRGRRRISCRGSWPSSPRTRRRR